MISGRDALHQIDAAIKNARQTVKTAVEASDDENQRLLETRQTEARLYHTISEIRLKSLEANEPGVNSLGRVDIKATDLIEQHEKHIMALEDAHTDAADTLHQCEERRRTAEDSLAEAIAAHESAAEKTRARLDEDANYQARAEALEKANAIVDHAASKREVATDNRTEKGRPYEEDPLFSYLWKRKYATNAYKAGPISTMLDRWVAGLIRYRDARLNYERLLEIPERLSEHLAFVEEKAATLADDIEAYERDALEKDGVTSLRDAAKTKRQELDNLDAEITIAEQNHHNALETLEQAGRGDEGPIHEARRLLKKAMEDKSIPDLKILAAETLTPEDDLLVEELAELRLERFSLEEETQTAKRRLSDHQRTLSDLEKLRRRFKQARFDSHRSEFKNDELISLLLTDFVRGSLGATEVWRKIERNHRLRQRDWQDDFGGDGWRDGFGLPEYGSRRGRSNHQGTNWGRIGRDISREIERELGRSLGGGLGSGFDLDDIFDLDDMLGSDHRSRRSSRRSPRRRAPRPRRRPRSISRPRSVNRPTRRSRSSRRRGGGGFKTGGGF